MASSAMKRVNKISQIVRLKQVMQRWKTISLKSRSVLSYSDSDSDSTPYDVRRGRIPSGSLAVYVGPERSRFVIPTRFLHLPVFVSLLNQAEEEYGFQTSGGLILPCEVSFFKRVLRFLYGDENRFGGLGLDDFVELFNSPPAASAAATCKDATNSCHSFTPLLPKTRA